MFKLFKRDRVKTNLDKLYKRIEEDRNNTLLLRSLTMNAHLKKEDSLKWKLN